MDISGIQMKKAEVVQRDFSQMRRKQSILEIYDSFEVNQFV